MDKGHAAQADCGCADGAAETSARRANGKAMAAAVISGSAFFIAGNVAVRYLGESPAPPALFLAAYLLLGSETLARAFLNIRRGKVFDENSLMTMASAGAIALGEYAEAAAVMLFYRIGEYMQDKAVKKSRAAIKSLTDIRPDYANALRDGVFERVSPEGVMPGEIISVKPGEKVPIDGTVESGEAALDERALTGEPAPRRVAAGDAVLSGSVCSGGALTILTTNTFGESTASKIISLVEDAAARKAPAENFITRFARYYTPAVAVLAVLIAFAPPLFFGGTWGEWISKGLVFLVISCPCALVISVPLGFFGGIGGASKKGILVKGGNYLNALCNLDTVVFDKTGTLTEGVFEVTSVIPADGRTRDELIEAAAFAEALSRHPVAAPLLREYGKEINRGDLTGFAETPGRGVSVTARGRKYMAGNMRMMEEAGISCEETDASGSAIHAATDGEYLGCVSVSDRIRADGASAVSALRERGVRRIVMLTGDSQENAEAAAMELNMDEAYGGLLPDQKIERLEVLSGQKYGKGLIAFAGDGINDAPALAAADVGVAMGGLGSDAAVEAADVVLMTDEPSKLAKAVDIARFTRRVVTQNIVFALSVKVLFMLLGFAGAASMREAIFADVGVALLAVLNSMRAMRA